jgi:hypothetical protein
MAAAKFEISKDNAGKFRLYLLDAQRRLHLLRPFLIAMQCAICRNPSTFHIDRVTSAGPEIKSLEDEHTTTRRDLQNSFARAGLLEPDMNAPHEG